MRGTICLFDIITLFWYIKREVRKPNHKMSMALSVARGSICISFLLSKKREDHFEFR
jgi:hypothetical protein